MSRAVGSVADPQLDGAYAAWDVVPTSRIIRAPCEPWAVIVTLPDAPSLANDTERRVWRLLTDQLGECDLVIAGQRLTDHVILPNSLLRQHTSRRSQSGEHHAGQAAFE